MDDRRRGTAFVGLGGMTSALSVTLHAHIRAAAGLSASFWRAAPIGLAGALIAAGIALLVRSYRRAG